MLHWFRGGVQDTMAEKTNGIDSDDKQLEAVEPPETPAPLFAIRAFQTALFGTPRIADEALENRDQPTRIIRPLSIGDVPKCPIAPDEKPIIDASPTKPSGILLTPRTTTARRKTVSFGAGVLDNEGKRKSTKSGLPNDYPGKFPSPWTPKLVHSNSERLVNSSKSLEDASSVVSKSNEVRITRSQGLLSPKTDEVSEVTTDINDPKSTSGQYWKSEFEKQKDESRHELKKLSKYKQMAKSYAKKKDTEALFLRDKLREERVKVSKMEEEIVHLASQLAMSRTGEDENGRDIMADLTRQTALALEYKAKVDQFAEVVDHHLLPHKPASPSTQQTLILTGQELKRAREQLRDVEQMQSDLTKLRETTKVEQQRSQLLLNENSVLTKDLAVVRNKLAQSEKALATREEMHKLKDERQESQKRECKELLTHAKNDRRKLEHILDSRYQQEKAALLEEIASLKATATETSQQNQPYSDGRLIEKLKADQRRLVESYKLEISQLKALNSTSDVHDPSYSEWQRQQRKTLQQLRQAQDEASRHSMERETALKELRECQAQLNLLKREAATSRQRSHVPSFIDSPLIEVTGRASQAAAFDASRSPTKNLEWQDRAANLSPILMDMDINKSYDTETAKTNTSARSPSKNSIFQHYKPGDITNDVSNLFNLPSAEASIIQGKEAAMQFPSNYPYSPPSFKFFRPIFHPNIYPDGNLCISILHAPGEDETSGEAANERWSPAQRVESVLLSIISLLDDAEVSSPANVDAGVMFRKDPAGYKARVKQDIEASKQDIPEGFVMPKSHETCIQRPVLRDDDQAFWFNSEDDEDFGASDSDNEMSFDQDYDDEDDDDDEEEDEDEDEDEDPEPKAS
ncbi:MAG: hypothetical protein M1829_004150 [Trizodia sp. TS-e1964]|nr:MAG: hypothetical protein M1829_004150 [Trizodia sp. TS-e1964]